MAHTQYLPPPTELIFQLHPGLLFLLLFPFRASYVQRFPIHLQSPPTKRTRLLQKPHSKIIPASLVQRARDIVERARDAPEKVGVLEVVCRVGDEGGGTG